MTDLDLKILLDNLAMRDVAQDATFGIFKQGEDAAAAYIKANREGLLHFASRLLNAARDTAGLTEDSPDRQVALSQDMEWIDEQSDIWIESITLVPHKEVIRNGLEPKESFLSRLLPAGCITVLIILIIAIPVGLWTLGRWIFSAF